MVYIVNGMKLFTTAQKSVATSAIENNFILNRSFGTDKQILFDSLTFFKAFIFSSFYFIFDEFCFIQAVFLLFTKIIKSHFYLNGSSIADKRRVSQLCFGVCNRLSRNL